MEKIESYATKEAHIRLLLQGSPGSGKTTLACGFPKAYFVDLDVNLAGPLRYCKNHNLPMPVGYDRLDLDDAGKPVPLNQRFDRLDKKLLEVQQNDMVKTIVLDSATGLAEILMAHVERQNPSVKDGRMMYGFFLRAGLTLIGKLTQMQKHIVLIAHEKVEQDAMTQITQFRLAWPGQLGDYMGAFFTNVWRTEVKKEGFPPKYSRVIRTIQDTQYHGLKNDFELPAEMTFDWKFIEEKLSK